MKVPSITKNWITCPTVTSDYSEVATSYDVSDNSEDVTQFEVPGATKVFEDPITIHKSTIASDIHFSMTDIPSSTITLPESNSNESNECNGT